MQTDLANDRDHFDRLFFKPFPGGTLSLAIGLSILICASLPFALWAQTCRRRFKFVNKAFTFVGKAN